MVTGLYMLYDRQTLGPWDKHPQANPEIAGLAPKQASHLLAQMETGTESLQFFLGSS